MTRPWSVFLVLGSAVAAASAFGHHPVSLAAATILQVSAGFAVLVGVRRHRPSRPLFWWLTAASLFAYSAAQAYWRIGYAGWKPPIPFENADDWLYYLAFGLFGAALAVRAGSGQAPASRRANAVDGLLVVLGVSAATWHYIAEPYMSTRGLDAAQSALFWGYELLDLVRLAFLAMIVMSGGARNTVQRLILVGMTVPLLGDVIYTVEIAFATHLPIGVPNLAWLLGSVLIAAGALHPTMAEPPEHRTEIGFVSGPRLIIFVLLTAVIPVVTGLDDVLGVTGRHLSEGAWIQMALGVAVGVLLVLRMSMLGAVSHRRAEQLEEALGEQAVLRAQLEHRATHDPLTGLGNRTALMQGLETALSVPVGAGRGWLLLLDLDGFKQVNDTLGHPVGDALLVALAGDLAAATPPGGLVTRLGGDEFAIVLPPGDPEPLAERILEIGARERPVDGHAVRVSASIGLLPLDRVGDSSSALREVDVALYSAKAAGRGCFRLAYSSPSVPGSVPALSGYSPAAPGSSSHAISGERW